MRRRFSKALQGAALAATAALLGSAPAASAAPSVYVNNLTSGTVSQYSVAADGRLTAKTPATVPSVTGGSGFIGLTPDRKSLYVSSNAAANLVAQFSIAADGSLSAKSPATVTADRPQGVAVTPDGKTAFFTMNNMSAANGSVSQLDIAANGTLSLKTPASIGSGGAQPTTMVVNAAGTRAYVANGTPSTIAQFSIGPTGLLSALSPATVPAGASQTQGITLSPDGRFLYATGRGSNTIAWLPVSPIDGTLGAALGSIPTGGGQPNRLTLTPDGKHAYVANQRASDGNTITQFAVAADGSLSTLTPATIPSSGMTPKYVAISSDGKSAYVANQGSNDIGQYAIASDGTLSPKSPATIATGVSPFDAVFAEAPVPPTGPPAATTGAASAISGSGATLAASVDPNGLLTTYVFEYGTTTSFGSITPADDAGLSSGAVSVASSLTGLAPSTTYYYRAVASSSAGTTVGTVRSFRTAGAAQAPVAITQPASAIGTMSATLSGHRPRRPTAG